MSGVRNYTNFSWEDWHTEEDAGLHQGSVMAVLWHKPHPSDTIPLQDSHKCSYVLYLQQEQGVSAISTIVYILHQLIPECISPVLCTIAWEMLCI